MLYLYPHAFLLLLHLSFVFVVILTTPPPNFKLEMTSKATLSARTFLFVLVLIRFGVGGIYSKTGHSTVKTLKNYIMVAFVIE